MAKSQENASENANKVEQEYGLDIPLEKARKIFSNVTKEEQSHAPSLPTLIPEGELELVAFKGAEIRRQFHNDEWWYSIVDVVGALSGSDRSSKYWADLKTKLIENEGFLELSDKIGKLPLPGADGKSRMSEVATPETIFRIVQSISSPKAEPFKRWLAKVGYERIQEWQDPEIAIKRAIVTYQAQGRSDDWIEKRIRSIVVRKELTTEWKKRGVKDGQEYGTLTTTISQQTFGVPPERHRLTKGLSKAHNLRDHMTDMELILTMLGETSTKEIAQRRDAKGFSENFHAATAGGKIAGTARKQIEVETGRPVVSSQNFLGNKTREADPERLSKPPAD